MDFLQWTFLPTSLFIKTMFFVTQLSDNISLQRSVINILVHFIIPRGFCLISSKFRLGTISDAHCTMAPLS